jgi:hypothetical protein
MSDEIVDKQPHSPSADEAKGRGGTPKSNAEEVAKADRTERLMRAIKGGKDQKKTSKASNEQKPLTDMDSSPSEPASKSEPAPKDSDKDSDASDPARKVISALNNVFSDFSAEGLVTNIGGAFTIINNYYYGAQTSAAHATKPRDMPTSTEWSLFHLNPYAQLFAISLAILNGLRRTQVIALHQTLVDTLLKMPPQPKEMASAASTEFIPTWRVDPDLFNQVGATTTTITEQGLYGKLEVTALRFSETSRASQVLTLVREHPAELGDLADRLIPVLINLVERDDFEVRARIAAAIGEIGRNDLPRILGIAVQPWANDDKPWKRVLVGYCLEAIARDEKRRENIRNVINHWAKTNNFKLKWSAAVSCGVFGNLDPEAALDILGTLINDQEEDLKLITYGALTALAYTGQFQKVVNALVRWSRVRERQKVFNAITAFAVIVSQLGPQSGNGSKEKVAREVDREVWESTWKEIANAARSVDDSALINDLVTILHIGLFKGQNLGRFLRNLLRSWIGSMNEIGDMHFSVMTLINRMYTEGDSQEKQWWEETLKFWIDKAAQNKSTFEEVFRHIRTGRQTST